MRSSEITTNSTGDMHSDLVELKMNRDCLNSPISRFSESVNRRHNARVSHRILDRLSVSIKMVGGDRWVPASIRDFSSSGFGLLFQMNGRDSVPEFNIREGESVLVKIMLPMKGEFQVKCKIRSCVQFNEDLRCGLSREDILSPEQKINGINPFDGFSQLPGPSIRARIPHPFILGHTCLITVLAFERDLKITFLTHDPSMLLYEGMPTAITFDLPMKTLKPIEAVIEKFQTVTPNCVRFSIRCISMPHSLHLALCEHLMGAHRWTPTQLRKAGYKPSRAGKHMHFQTVESLEDYSDVLNLRRDAYVRVGKRPNTTTPECMSGHLDGKSRILTARHQNLLVASMTFAFPESEETVLDTQLGFPDRKYPIPLPPKIDTIDIARLCIHEGYRGTDIVMGLIAQGFQHFLLSDRNWLLTSATKDMIPFYLNIGFKKLNAVYRHHLLQNKEHHLIIGNKNSMLWGNALGLLTWNLWYGEVVAFLLDRKLIKLPSWQIMIIRGKLLFMPIAKWNANRILKADLKKHLQKKTRRTMTPSAKLLPNPPMSCAGSSVNKASFNPGAGEASAGKMLPRRVTSGP